MSVIKPFHALRPVRESAKQVSCVPYDVIHESEAREFVEQNPQSFLRVTRSESAFPAAEKPAPEAVLQRARENLGSMVTQGVMVKENQAAFYIYRLTSDSHTQTGVVACCSLDEYDSGLIKKHEKTRPDKVKDRTEHMLAIRAQTGLIFLAFRGTERIQELIDEATRESPLYDFESSDGVRHTVWSVSETQPLVDAFAEVPALYIADGHHRAESAARARRQLREANPGHTGKEDYNFMLAGIFPAEELKILPYNRVVHDLNGLTDVEFLEKLKGPFAVRETEVCTPLQHGEICMYLTGRWYKLEFNAGLADPDDPVGNLDVSILQRHVLAPILGIADPRTNTRIEFIGGSRGTGELVRLVDNGSARVAFSLYPTTIDDLLEISDRGQIMPPKSTWFEPKLKDGLFVHTI